LNQPHTDLTALEEIGAVIVRPRLSIYHKLQEPQITGQNPFESLFWRLWIKIE
jgi:hypothetical protein